MNKVILMGRLTRDPDFRYSQNDSQVALCRFTLAVDRRFKRDAEQTADFISCVCFGKTAEFIRDYMKQGSKICLEGRIQTGNYTRQDGQKVYTTDVVVENVEFAESKAAASGYQRQQPAGGYQQNQGGYSQGGYQQNSAPQFQPSQAQPAPMPQTQPPAMEAAGEGFMNIADGLEDEGLPFN